MKSPREVIKLLEEQERLRNENVLAFLDGYQTGKFNVGILVKMIRNNTACNVLKDILEAENVEEKYAQKIKPKKQGFKLPNIFGKFKVKAPEPDYPGSDHDIEASY